MSRQRPSDTAVDTSGHDLLIADRVAVHAAVGATLRATTDALARTCAGLTGAPAPPAIGHRLDELIGDVRSQLPGSCDDLDPVLAIAADSTTHLTELARRVLHGRDGAFSVLGRLGCTVADAYHLAVEAWIATGPDGTREAVIPPHLLDLPAELTRATAELDELAAGSSRRTARELLAATDLLLGLGRDVGRLVQRLTTT